MSQYKKYIVLIIIVLILICGSVFILYKRALPTHTQQQTEQIVSTTDTKEWLTYHDKRYHFRIDYQSNLTVSSGDGVSFNEAGEGPWMSGVSIATTSFRTPEEVVAMEMQYENQTTVIDNPITIAGYHGVVVHNSVEGFDHPFPKSVLFIKDGYLFEISDRTDNYKRTWNSFHFEE